MTNEKNNNKDLVSVKESEHSSIDEILEKETFLAPLTDIYESEDEFVLTANMPGVSRENIQIKLEDTSLAIFGRINFAEAVKRNYILNENEIGNYYRKFNISNSIDETRIEAMFENGQLIVRLPKHDRVKPRTINVR
jgi:HSP20 family molecular chaperone IbpA